MYNNTIQCIILLKCTHSRAFCLCAKGVVYFCSSCSVHQSPNTPERNNNALYLLTQCYVAVDALDPKRQGLRARKVLSINLYFTYSHVQVHAHWTFNFSIELSLSVIDFFLHSIIPSYLSSVFVFFPQYTRFHFYFCCSDLKIMCACVPTVVIVSSSASVSQKRDSQINSDRFLVLSLSPFIAVAHTHFHKNKTRSEVLIKVVSSHFYFCIGTSFMYLTYQVGSLTCLVKWGLYDYYCSFVCVHSSWKIGGRALAVTHSFMHPILLLSFYFSSSLSLLLPRRSSRIIKQGNDDWVDRLYESTIICFHLFTFSMVYTTHPITMIYYFGENLPLLKKTALFSSQNDLMRKGEKERVAFSEWRKARWRGENPIDCRRSRKEMCVHIYECMRGLSYMCLFRWGNNVIWIGEGYKRGDGCKVSSTK